MQFLPIRHMKRRVFPSAGRILKHADSEDCLVDGSTWSDDAAQHLSDSIVIVHPCIIPLLRRRLRQYVGPYFNTSEMLISLSN